MTSRALILRGLQHYWRTNLAVVAGVATAVAVLAGALLVGDSVRGSLRDLVLQRLGRTDRIVVATNFFREALADDLRGDADFAAAYTDITPLIVMQGLVTELDSGRRASRVQVYGVDDRFWRFHHVAGRTGPADREAFLSRALAADVGAAPGGTVLVRLERPSAIPTESLHGQKEDPGRTVRLTVGAVIDPDQLGDFSIQPQQGAVRAVFVRLSRLQQDLDQKQLVNAMLVTDHGPPNGDALTALLKRHARLEDYALSLQALDDDEALAVETTAGFIDTPRSDAIEHAGVVSGTLPRPVLTYLANSIRSGDRQVPYSLVTAISAPEIAPELTRAWRVDPDPPRMPPPIVLNDWTARELGVKPGDPVFLDYYIWQEPGALATRSAEFKLAAVVPIAGAAADRRLAPVYPGISDADTLGDWDPPFPIDLKRVRPVDEAYWNQYRTTPKAFIPFGAGRELWTSRYGDRTSFRILPAGQPLAEARRRFETALRAELDPSRMGFTVRGVRAEALDASRGSTDFGEYFVYFSFFLVASALVLAVLFFRLGVEQRAREVGLLRAVGFSTPRVRRLFAAEGLLLALAGSILGMAGAVAYGALMMAGLRTWWSGAVGTTSLTLHVSPLSLLAGAAGAVIAATGCIWWTLRGFARLSERALLAGQIAPVTTVALRRRRAITASAGLAVFSIAGVALIAAAAARRVDPAGAFFGAGASVLMACLCALTLWLRAAGRHSAPPSVARLGIRNTSERPGRSVLAIAVIASATFILISVDAFRKGDADAAGTRSGTGGYPLMVDLLLPVIHDPNSPEGRLALGLEGRADVSIEPFRVRPGDETSCLNLYEPTNPRILGVSRRMIDAGRFAFQGSLAASAAEQANPWLLLTQTLPDGVIPIAADANSMTYVLHKSLGDELVLNNAGRRVRLRFVAALQDSVLQSELLMAEPHFIALFPEQQGYQFLMIDVAPEQAAAVSAAIERGAGDLGADATPTAQRLAEFHAVENTYLSTFQTLGGLGLLVGTIGLAAVLLRNILERRRELALLRAVGYGRSHLFGMILSENAVLLGWGLATGALSALVAIAPAAFERGARLPLSSGGWSLLVAVLAAGLVSSLIATRAALRAPLIAALRAE